MRRPAPDPVNAMLSFAYTLLEKDIRRAAAAAGLSPYIGFLHELNYRKDSLIYDLMEPFRPLIADRFVLKCINLRIFTQDDFVMENGRCLFTEESKKRFIDMYENFITANDDAEYGLKKQIEYEVKILSGRLYEFSKAA